MLGDNIGVEPIGDLRTGCGAGQLIEFTGGERSRLDDERRQELRFDVASVPKLERELVIGFDLFGQLAEVAQFYAKLIVWRTGFDVVLPPSVVAEGFELCEDFFDGHQDDYTRKLMRANEYIQ